MTTEPTLREKVLDDVFASEEPGIPYVTARRLIDRIADLLSATGVTAYIRVAEDLRGVVREEGENVVTSGVYDCGPIKYVATESIAHPARYLGQFDKRGEGK